LGPVIKVVWAKRTAEICISFMGAIVCLILDMTKQNLKEIGLNLPQFMMSKETKIKVFGKNSEKSCSIAITGQTVVFLNKYITEVYDQVSMDLLCIQLT
jgi:hypothetical protein